MEISHPNHEDLEPVYHHSEQSRGTTHNMAQNSTAESKQEADHGAFAFQMLHRIQPAKDNDPSKPRDVDPADPNRSVPTKKANQAYLVHQRYLEQQKEKQRKERIAKGLDPDVEEKVEEAGPAVIDLGLFFKRLFIGILLWAAAGFFITGSPIWGYRGKWIRMRTYFPVGTLAAYTRRCSYSADLFALSDLLLTAPTEIVHTCRAAALLRKSA